MFTLFTSVNFHSIIRGYKKKVLLPFVLGAKENLTMLIKDVGKK